MDAIVPCARTDITPTRDGAYHEVDISGLAPAGAIAAILEVWNTDTDYRGFAIRKKGSTDDFYHDIYGNVFKYPNRTAFYAGLDEDRIFEAKIEVPTNGEGVRIIIYAYIPGDVGTFFDNAIDVTPSLNGYQTIDITAHTGSDVASAGIFILVNENLSATKNYVLRPYGNNYTSVATIFNYCQTGLFMGCDEYECFEVSLQTDEKIYLIGYLNEGYWENINPVQTHQISEVEVWEDYDLSSWVPAGTLFALVIEKDTASIRLQWGIRKNGSSVDNYAYNCIGINTIVELDALRTIEIKCQDKSSPRWWLIGYLAALSGTSGMGEII